MDGLASPSLACYVKLRRSISAARSAYPVIAQESLSGSDNRCEPTPASSIVRCRRLDRLGDPALQIDSRKLSSQKVAAGSDRPPLAARPMFQTRAFKFGEQASDGGFGP